MLRLWSGLFAVLALFIAASVAVVALAAPFLPSPGIISYTLGYRYDLVLVDVRTGIHLAPLEFSVNGGVSWSPDGRYMAFNRPRISRGFLLDFAEEDIVTIENAGLYVSAFRWKPDGRTATYPHNDTLFAYDTLTRRITALMSLPNRTPYTWLPDGDHIVYPAGSPTFGVWVQNVKTEERRRVTDPAWAGGGFTALPYDVSSDGCCVPYTYFDAGGRFFGVLNLTDGESRALFFSQRREGFVMPVWSPDNQQIALVRDQFASPEAFIDVVDVESGRTRRLLTTDRTIGAMAWFSW